MWNRRLDLWLPSYVLEAPQRFLGKIKRARHLTHIVFLICDHFEPRHGVKRETQPQERLQIWCREYARLQERCRVEFGMVPKHTWFYPPHHGAEHLASLAEMVFSGLGEVELHYHHDGDNAESLRRDLRTAIAEYHRWGLLLESGETPRTVFGFIHGDWALDNSCGGRYCGVNGELRILEELGCWGDFTMPSANECQTRKINSIYYAVGDSGRSKSHDRGQDARVGEPDPPGLFLMQGPLGINWRAPDYPHIENASLTTENWGRLDRIRKWLDCQVHVKGRPDWLFIKLHAHGAIERDFDALFGERAYATHRMLNEQYNDGRHYRLHYATARQAYNIAKAAEHGKGGDPSNWLDYIISLPANAYYSANARHELKCCTPVRLTLTGIEPGAATRVRNRVGPITQIGGPLTMLDLDHHAKRMEIMTNGPSNEIALEADSALDVVHIDGGLVVKTHDEAGRRIVRLSVNQRATITYRSKPVNRAELIVGNDSIEVG